MITTTPIHQLRGLTALFTALVLAGCATAPLPALPPVADLPAAFKTAADDSAAAPAAAAWWQAFGDARLDTLIRRADAHNPSVQVAAARLAEAQAALRSADAERLPQVGAGAGLGREAEPGARGRAASLATLSANAAYEVDVAGRLAGASRAAALDAQAQQALLQGARLLVQTEVARSYFALRALDDEQALVADTLAAYRRSLQLTERRFDAGDVAELDLVRVRGEAAATEAEGLTLARQRSRLAHALAVLTGAQASSFELAPAPLATALPRVPPGLPASVLARRPDVAAAQSTLRAAYAREGVARNAWLPSLQLTANGGWASGELSDLLKWPARAWGVGALLSLPIFDGGRREAGVARAEAAVDAATASYRAQVLVALQEVEDELSSLQLLHRQAGVQAEAVGAAARATALSDVRYRNGFVSQLELLDAQRSELRNRREALHVRAAQYASTVALIRALGGGWGEAG